MADLQECLVHSRTSIHERLHAQWDVFNLLRQRIQGYLKNGVDLGDLADFIDSFTLPRLSMPKNSPTEVTDQAFRSARDKAKKCLDKWAGKLEPFRREILLQDLFCSSDTIRVFIEEVAVKWHRELFEQHVEKRRLTFSHLERLAMQLLHASDGGPSEIAQYYRSRFRHILVDEFQDTNQLQESIIRALCRPCDDAAGGNLFVVGDVKQSIYEFRQAEPDIFLGIYKNSGAYDVANHTDTRLDLAENFRSDPALLDEFNRIFAWLLQEGTVGVDYSAGHAFKPGRTESRAPHRTPRFQIDLLPRQTGDDGEEPATIEARHVARLVKQLGPPWKDICILLRSTVGSAGELVEAFNEVGVPVFCDSKLGFLTAVEVIEFQTLLRAVYNPYEDVALLGALRGPAGEWNEEELLALRHLDRRAAFYAILSNVAENVEHELSEKANRFLEQLRLWQEESTRLPMAEFFARLFDSLDLLERASVRPGGDQRRLNLLHMLEQAREFDSFLRKGLGEFLTFLADMIANDEDFAPPSPLPSDADVVRIMSIHKSKGMQFPVVILPFTGKKFNDANLGQSFLFDRELGVATRLRDVESDLESLPPIYEIIRAHRKRKERAEELRLLYVALTRAQESVFVVGSVKEPAETIEHLCARGTLPPAGEILEAANPAEWIMNHAAHRFQIPIMEPEYDVYDGIAVLRVKPAPAVVEPEAVNLEKAREVEPELIADLGEARKRIIALSQSAPPSKVRAKVSVSELKRAYDTLRDAETPPMPAPLFPGEVDRAAQWLPPQFRPDATPTGANRGTATHRFLANCALVELSRGDRTLSQESKRLVDSHMLTQEEASLINLHNIAWFLNGPLGKRVQLQATRLHRERPFSVRVDGGEFGQQDLQEPTILQGVVDLFFREEAGWILVDYKTDFCGENGERIDYLVEGYTPQLQLYRLLVERTLREPVAETWLVFLGGRQLRQVPPAENPAEAIRSLIEAGAVLFPQPEGRRITYSGI
jgi:ATP-dependent helicase/nuclease subunit A